MNTCTCDDGTCDFCVTMLWAAEFEVATTDEIGMVRADIDRAVEGALAEANVVSRHDLDGELEEYVKNDALEEAIRDNTDIDSIVESRPFERAIESEVETALGHNAFVTEDALETALESYVEKATAEASAARLALRVAELERVLAGSFFARLRFVFLPKAVRR